MAAQYEHLGMWTREEGTASYRLDLWDTGRTGEYGKPTLRYALAIITPPVDSRVVILEGEDFHPSPLHAIDRDDTAGALLAFFAAYGDPDSGADMPEEYTPRQREALAAHTEVLSMWSYELEGEQ